MPLILKNTPHWRSAQGPGQCGPNVCGGFAFPGALKSHNLKQFAIQDFFSSDFPGTFLQNSRKDPRNSHILLECSESPYLQPHWWLLESWSWLIICPAYGLTTVFCAYSSAVCSHRNQLSSALREDRGWWAWAIAMLLEGVRDMAIFGKPRAQEIAPNPGSKGLPRVLRTTQNLFLHRCEPILHRCKRLFASWVQKTWCCTLP